MKKIVVVLFLLIASIPSIVLAEDISVEELLGSEQQESAQNIEEMEEQRTEEIENALKISIPEYTDNPSHIITFVDPSQDDVGVELDIDEKGYKEINSPYSLPSLGIGEHHLKFRFVDSIGATKLLEYDIVIIPRPPIIQAPQFTENSLLLSGTGLAKSEILLTVSVGANNYTSIAAIDKDGSWTSSIPLESIPSGIYTIFGYSRKDGYASNPSEPAVLEYGTDGIVQISADSQKSIYFKFADINWSEITTIIKENPDLLIASISFLLLGTLITAILFTVIKGIKEKGEEVEISKKINGNKPKEEKTLMELFTEEEVREKKPKTKKSDSKKKRRKKKKEKVFSKQDFLKDFQRFDPDNEKGEEVKEPTKNDKRDVIVTLTSKREEE